MWVNKKLISVKSHTVLINNWIKKSRIKTYRQSLIRKLTCWRPVMYLLLLCSTWNYCLIRKSICLKREWKKYVNLISLCILNRRTLSISSWYRLKPITASFSIPVTMKNSSNSCPITQRTCFPPLKRTFIAHFPTSTHFSNLCEMFLLRLPSEIPIFYTARGWTMWWPISW